MTQNDTKRNVYFLKSVVKSSYDKPNDNKKPVKKVTSK